mgnify:CR=1 FL=1
MNRNTSVGVAPAGTIWRFQGVRSIDWSVASKLSEMTDGPARVAVCQILNVDGCRGHTSQLNRSCEDAGC